MCESGPTPPNGGPRDFPPATGMPGFDRGWYVDGHHLGHDQRSSPYGRSERYAKLSTVVIGPPKVAIHP